MGLRDAHRPAPTGFSTPSCAAPCLDVAEAVAGKRNGEANKWTYGEAKAAGVQSVREGTGGRCDDECVAAVLDAYHKDQCKGSDDQEIRAFCPKDENSKLWQKAFGDAAPGQTAR